MKQPQQPETFEQVLLSHAEMCYSVALAFTRNPHRAQHLTRTVLTRAWHSRDNADCAKHIKKKLLTELRNMFLKEYCQKPFAGAGETPFADASPCASLKITCLAPSSSHSGQWR